jgi:3-oxoacyl-[acyl-carrier-protein] synthase-1
MKKKIYLSKPALVCSAGNNTNELYESCLKGNQNGLVIREYDNRKFPVGFVNCKLPEVGLPNFRYPNFAGKTKLFRLINAALVQLTPIIEKTIIKYGREKIGICFGSCDNGSESSYVAHYDYFEKGSFTENYNLNYQSASFPADFISEMFGLTGPVYTIATACASGASAIIRGVELIRAGICDAVIAGGADIVSQTVFAGFNVLEAVSDSLTNPFSKNRKGINLGEGAAFFLIDSENISNIELLGIGESSDAYHMTAPGEDGLGPARAMNAALFDAGIDSKNIGYVNLHGTGTVLNDKSESLALKNVFDADVPVSSTKPITGHTLGAAGALEAAICWMVINEKRGLPVHCWDGVYDEEAPFLPAGPHHESPAICMTNSFAFGGCNVSLILGYNSGVVK